MGVGSPFDLRTSCFRLRKSNETAKIRAHHGKTWRQAGEAIYEHGTVCKSRNKHCTIVRLISTRTLGLCDCLRGQHVPVPAISSRDSRSHGSLQYQQGHSQSARRLVQATARVGKNCLDENKEVISQLEQKWNKLLLSSYTQGVSQRLCVRCRPPASHLSVQHLVLNWVQLLWALTSVGFWVFFPFLYNPNCN